MCENPIQTGNKLLNSFSLFGGFTFFFKATHPAAFACVNMPCLYSELVIDVKKQNRLLLFKYWCRAVLPKPTVLVFQLFHLCLPGVAWWQHMALLSCPWTETDKRLCSRTSLPLVSFLRSFFSLQVAVCDLAMPHLFKLKLSLLKLQSKILSTNF